MGGGLLAPRPTPKLEDHPLSVVRDCIFNRLYSQLPSISGGRTYIRNPTTRHAVVTVDTLNISFLIYRFGNTVFSRIPRSLLLNAFQKLGCANYSRAHVGIVVFHYVTICLMEPKRSQCDAFEIVQCQ
jgi:hypothetical protein